MLKDAKVYVTICDKCQRHGDMHIVPPTELAHYSKKWIEVEPLAKITSKSVLRFFIRNILARFGIPALVVSDNRTQSTDRKFQDYLRNFGIK